MKNILVGLLIILGTAYSLAQHKLEAAFNNANMESIVSEIGTDGYGYVIETRDKNNQPLNAILLTNDNHDVGDSVAFTYDSIIDDSTTLNATMCEVVAVSYKEELTMLLCSVVLQNPSSKLTITGDKFLEALFTLAMMDEQ